MESLAIKVTGKVQGVFFRKNTVKAAKKLNINGFVKNMPDGGVYIEVEGDEKHLEEFITWCWKGPLFARVENVEVIEMDFKGYESFEIVK